MNIDNYTAELKDLNNEVRIFVEISKSFISFDSLFFFENEIDRFCNVLLDYING